MHTKSCSAVLAWGRKKSAAEAIAFAKNHDLPVLQLEDGFLRSVNLGSQDTPLSIVVDDLGIYYDAYKPSRLEELVVCPLSVAQISRTRLLILLWCNARVSKYNFASESVRVSQCPYVLVTDQTYGDLSIQYGQADASSFQRMLDAALQENPHCHVLLKIHPDVALGKKKGHFDVQAVAKNPRITLLSDAVHPVRLIEQAESVYCVTSQMGFEALLWGKPVRTFGMPFYAGWGLTQDDLPRPERRKTIALENLVHAALIAYPRYIDPETLQRCEVERLIEWMGLQRQMRGRFPAVVEAAGFSAYKKPIVRRFFQGSTVYFDRKPAKWAEDATQVLWGKKAGFKSVPPAKQKKVIRLEDGFIRSVGLGADLIAPLSWAMDTRGIYYDAGQVSDLEYILQTTVFADGMLERSKNIRTRLLAEGISKYNVGAGTWQRGDAGSKAAGTLILVPGQVETDASIAYGALGLTSNLELLKAVRLANPEAYLIYKPHPDVVAGLRKKGRGETKANDFCDLILNAIDMAHLLEQVDEVHTLTSLTGFEALLRGKKVVCYGLPFYAGWGLTDDKLPLPRRSRTLFLDELVAGALIVYPTYISCSTGKFTTPERALDELLLWRATASTRLPWWRVLLRYFLRLENFVAQSVAALQGK